MNVRSSPQAEHSDDAASSDAMRALFARTRRQAIRPYAEVDRFVVLRELGRGAMGVVFEAFDPQLERKVALKLLLVEDTGESDEVAARRLLQEAQALAKLSHPNVVAIHDVGIHEGKVWLAMEYVAGHTLRRWVTERRRTWREVLRVLIDVADGIAAAHAAGLVHRDLKPENVMIGAGGRVRVMDFGLAHRATVPGTDLVATDDAGPGVRSSRDASPGRFTRTGAVLGTPAYMAPEQWCGRDVGPAADQFAWSVMAWELLYGERPFAGETAALLAENVLSGERRSPVRGRGVPSWLRRIVERGLSITPAGRWLTMAELRAALSRGQTRARLRIAGLVLAGAAAVGVGLLGLHRWQVAQQVTACEAAGDALESVWNEDVRESVAASFVATEKPHVHEVFARTAPWIDRWAASWSDATTQACLARKVLRTWDEQELARTTACLDEAKDRFVALLAAFDPIDAPTLHRATAMAAGLPLVSPCLDNVALATRPALAENVRVEVAGIRARLAVVTTLRLAGKYAEGLAEARRIREQAGALGWRPLIAEAELALGHVAAKAGEWEPAELALSTAVQLFAEVDDPIGVVQAAIQQITLAEDTARYPEGHVWSKLATAQLAMLPGDHPLLVSDHHRALGNLHRQTRDITRARELAQEAMAIDMRTLGPEHPGIAAHLHNLAALEYDDGKYADGLALVLRGLSLREQALGANHPSVAHDLDALGTFHDATDAYPKALAAYARALAIRESTYGAEHALVGDTLDNLSTVYLKMGQLEKAREVAERGLRVREAVYGELHPSVATSLLNLANIFEASGQYEAARALHERGLTIKERVLGPEHPAVADSLNDLSIVHRRLKAYDTARALLLRSLEIKEKVMSPDHPLIADTLVNLALTSLDLGDLTQAYVYHTRALAIDEKTKGIDHPHVASSLVNLGMILLDQRKPAAALPLLERALHISESKQLSSDRIAAAKFSLARALWDSDADRDRALRFAEQALAEFGHDESTRARRDEVMGWLAHPSRRVKHAN
jgi:tetratricopeptide (TPR) repeat protein